MDGTLLVGGSSSVVAGAFNHAWMLRLDPAGAILWQRAYVGPTSSSIVWSLQELPDGTSSPRGTWAHGWGVMSISEPCG